MIFIPLKNLSPKLRSTLRTYLIEHESSCTQLVSVLKRNIKNAFAIYNNLSKKNTPEHLLGLINIKQTILFSMPFAEQEESSTIKNNFNKTNLKTSFINDFSSFWKANNFNLPLCINGTAGGTSLIIKAIAKISNNTHCPVQINNYYLMELSKKCFYAHLKECKKSKWYNQFNKNIKIFRCKKNISPKIMEQIISLQCQYEKEEVLPAGWTFNEDLCHLKLKNQLTFQYILGLKLNDKTICKGGTNAIGIKFVQFGGIYTIPQFRNHHYAQLLMQCLCKKMLLEGKTPVLFVKKQNSSAKKLYQNIGFIKKSNYAIAYFNQNV